MTQTIRITQILIGSDIKDTNVFALTYNQGGEEVKTQPGFITAGQIKTGKAVVVIPIGVTELTATCQSGLCAGTTSTISLAAATPTPTPTGTVTPTPTNSPVPVTPTPTATTPGATPSPTPTNVVDPTPTSTPAVVPDTPTPTPTNDPVAATSTPTPTPVPDTPTPTPTSTPASVVYNYRIEDCDGAGSYNVEKGGCTFGVGDTVQYIRNNDQSTIFCGTITSITFPTGNADATLFSCNAYGCGDFIHCDIPNPGVTPTPTPVPVTPTPTPTASPAAAAPLSPGVEVDLIAASSGTGGSTASYSYIRRDGTACTGTLGPDQQITVCAKEGTTPVVNGGTYFITTLACTQNDCNTI